MSKISFLQRWWRFVVTVITIGAMAIFAMAIHQQLLNTLSDLGKVNAWALLLIIPCEVLNYHAQAKLYQRLFGVMDEQVRYRELLKLSLELNFVNHVFPSGGVSGLSYFGYRARTLGIRGTKATLVQSMKLLLLFISFEPLLLLGMLILAAGGKASDATILIASSLTMLLVCGTAGFIYIIGSQRRINGFLTFMTLLVNKLIHLVRWRHSETINIEQAREVFEDFHRNYMLMRSRYTKLRVPFWWAFMCNLSEVLVVYVVYLAFGSFVSLGAIILAYAVANFAGLVSVLPGGAGIYEALMTGVLVTAGVPARLSLPVTVMYRVLNTLLQVPPGYILYQRVLHGRREHIPPS